MDKDKIIAEIYSTLNESERFGIRFALFPFRIHDIMIENNLSASDLMRYDEEYRKQIKVIKKEFYHYSDFEDDQLMAQYDDRSELGDE